MEPDNTTLEYVKNRAKRPYEVFMSDADAVYLNIIDYNVEKSGQKLPSPTFRKT